MMLITQLVFPRLCKHKKKLLHIANHNTIANILERNAPGDTVKIKGWVKSVRRMKENLFFDVNDGSSPKQLQVITPQAKGNNQLSAGSSIVAEGNLSTAPSGQLELQAKKIEILGSCVVSEGYPFAPRKSYAPEYVRQYLHLRPRTNKFASLLRIRNGINFQIQNYLYTNGFINIQAPIITSNDCEGAGEIFVVVPDNKSLLKNMTKSDTPQEEIYFGSKTFLSVSGQLHLEAAAHGLSKVYTFGPTFRAENSKSRHHLSEFYMLEVEIAFIDSIEELITSIEALMKSVCSNVLNKYSEDIANFQSINDCDIFVNKPFIVMDFEEATSILEKNNDKFKHPYHKGQSISKEHEIFLVKYSNSLVFIINWPKHMKPFYMRELNEDNTKVAALDLLGPEVGEIVGGSLRENDYHKLKAKIPEFNNKLEWYLDLRKFGSVPTAGFGLGLERLIQSVLGINNIRDTIPFPRWAHNCSM